MGKNESNKTEKGYSITKYHKLPSDVKGDKVYGGRKACWDKRKKGGGWGKEGEGPGC